MFTDQEQLNDDQTLGRLFGQIDSKQNLEEIFQAIADGVTVQDESGTVIFANDAAAKIMGLKDHREFFKLKPNEFVNTVEILDADLKPYNVENLPGRRVFRGECPAPAIICWRSKSGGIERWSEVKAQPIKDATDKIKYAVNVFRDITDQVRFTREIERTNRRSQHILESITDGFFALDKDWRVIYINKQAELLMRKNRAELLGRVIFEAFPDALQSHTYDKLKEALAKSESLRYEEYFGFSGEAIWVESTIYPTTDGIAVYLRDITKAKLADEFNSKLAAIVESSEDAIVGKSLDGMITSWNTGAEKIYGYTKDEIVGKSVSVLIPKGEEDDTFYFLDRIKTGSSIEHYETKRCRKDGQVITVSVTVSPIRNESGEIVGASAVSRDITESKQAEQAQRFLSEASLLLSSSLDYETTLSRVADLIVPNFADWCTVEILTPDGETTKQVTVAHVDPEKVAFAYEVARKYPPVKDPEQGLWKIIRTGKSEIYPHIPEELIRATAQSPEHAELMIGLGLRSVIMVPLVARHKIFGVISLIWAESGRNYAVKDLEFFEELGRRAGMAIDNAILYKEAQAEIAERKFMEQKLQVSEDRYRALIDNTSDGVALINESGIITFVTKPVERMLGRNPSQLIGQDMLQIVHPEDAAHVSELFGEILEKPNYPVTVQYRCLHADGRYRWIEGAGVNMLHHDSIKSIVVNFRDITERRHAEESLQYQYHHDSLTDLPNRTYLNEKLSQALDEAAAKRQSVALMLIDLDRFKQINESLGHALGDRLIQEVALRIRACINENYVLARLGGDEFGILIPDVHLEEDAAKLANKILEEFRPAFYLDKHELFISPSIGISLYPYDGKEASALLRNAEAALYRAKEYGRNTYQFYTTTMNAAAFERLTMESKLRHAIENQEFVLFYQPQVDVTSGKIVGTEELIRWQRPDMTLTLPDRFIPLAEANGLIEPIGAWIIYEALRQAKIWHDKGYKMFMAINLSPRQFKQKNFERMLLETIENSGFDTNFLEFELTESVLAENPENVINIMNALRERGVRFCLDDFSTGYSSLRYIKQFPVDMLKIERAFMKGIPHDMQNAAIAKSIITLGRSLNMEVTAEGVESKNQLAFLRDNLCNRAQGYLFNGAMPAHSLSEILDEDRYVSVVASLGKPHLF